MGFSMWMLARLMTILACVGKIKAQFEDAKILAITRDNNGDIFTAEGVQCNIDTCVGVSSGTAYNTDSKKEISPGNFCECQCHKHLPVFREDLRICVDDIRECSLAPFVSSSTVQQIPFVYLPLKGQIIYPSKEIKLTDLKSPICALSSAKFLSDNGWLEVRNPVDGDIPFRLFRDEGRVFLQWIGNSQQRIQMQGRLILVYIFCREASMTESQTDTPTILTPCVSFRIAGKPIPQNHNITEVSFLDDVQAVTESNSSFSISEYVAIGICSILLALVYVASVLLYLHLRKKRRENETKTNETDSQNFNALEEGIIKNNPLLSFDKHFPGSTSSFTDSSSTVSENEDSPSILFEDKRNKKVQTSALVHLQKQDFFHPPTSNQDPLYQEPSSIEKLPEENVSIVETIEHRDQSDTLKGIAGNTRKKLYFNPAYFEPQLLMAPPPAAVEFLTKIREVMAIAKQKMASKRFTPSLNKIPEEESIETTYEMSRSIHSSHKNSIVSLKRENSRKRLCSGCRSCQTKNINHSVETIPELALLPACQNCTVSNESKERSIQKWLEEIPMKNSTEDWTYKIREDKRWSPDKRIKSPTRSLPPDTSSHLYRSLSPKPASESGRNPQFPYSNLRKPTKPSNLKPKKQKAPVPPVLQTSHCNIKKATITTSHQKKLLAKENLDPVLPEKKNTIYTNDNYLPSIKNKNLKLVTKDYDTDSLERSQQSKGCNNCPSDSENVSSHPSPSLSSALPMEEELTISNAVINAISECEVPKSPSSTNDSSIDGDYHLTVLKSVCQKVMDSSFYTLPELLQNSGNKGYNLVSEVYVNNGYSFNSGPTSPNASPQSSLQKRKPNVKVIQPEPGQLLIEVEDCPDNYIKVDEQNFEPDTLDRKPNKNDEECKKTSKIQLKTTGSFKTDLTQLEENENETNSLLSRNFGSLREIYQEKVMQKTKSPPPSLTDSNSKKCKEEGALLTLEERHARRQRRLTSSVPPDVIPPSGHNTLYGHPTPPQNETLNLNVSNERLEFSDKKILHFNHIEEKEIYENCKQGLFCNTFVNNDDDAQITLEIADLYDKIKMPIPVKVEHHVYNMNDMKTAANLSDIFKMKQSFPKIEDSGYMSTDSNYNNSKQSDCFKIHVTKEEGESETDDSLADGQSESGAESVETHSVFFGSYYGNSPCVRDSVDSGVDFEAKCERSVYPGEDCDGSDSEAMSYATVVPVRSFS